MKIAYVAAPSGRSAALERQRRERAEKATLAASFPQFITLRLDFEFSDDGPFTPAPQTMVLHPPARAYFVFPCPYSDCDGEFNLASRIVDMSRERQYRCEGQLRCEGRRHRNRDGLACCGLMLEYLVEAKGR